MATQLSRDLETDLNHEMAMGQGTYVLVKEVSVHGTLCAVKVIHIILLINATEEDNEKLKNIYSRVFSKQQFVTFQLGSIPWYYTTWINL